MTDYYNQIKSSHGLLKISRLNYSVTTGKLIAITRVRVMHGVWYIAMNISTIYGRVTRLTN